MDHTSTRSQMSSNATDTRLPAPFDTFEPPLISAASSGVKAVPWRTSIATLLIPLVAIFVGADAQSGGVFTSFEDYIRRLYGAVGIGDFNTTGNVSWTSDFRKITASGGSQTFTKFAIDALDKTQAIITDKLSITLAGILRLTL